MTKKPVTINEYRQSVLAALKDAGWSIEEWQRQYQEQQAANPNARTRPFTKLTPAKYGKIRKLRPGFVEFIQHPHHGHPVARCQAAKKRTDGKVQCAKFAANNTHLCRTHGGAKGSGKQSVKGRQNQIVSVTCHGHETNQKRAERRIALSELKELESLARSIGMISSGLGHRGPYYKPNRVGKPMEHLKRNRRI